MPRLPAARLVALLGALLLVVATATSGIAAQCLMTRHCGACPGADDTVALRAPPAACNMMSPASPRLDQTELPAYAPLVAIPVTIVGAVAPIAAAPLAVADIRPARGSRAPPGGLVLRI